ncbi:unnamed protein product [Rhizoctonia solani]|uniref:Uncharacterized protein n=1 Tax=Rhizoctonia solani TaxID=456999 RepID=A0A8H3AWF1_9AGAM|nr:unnamed protein product [Rhizoctonia solani]
MEQLIYCHKKYQRVLEHGHLFGNKHGCYFNPYSRSAINKKKCTRIDKPPGFQIGRGGPGSVPIHEAIGLRDDYDYRLDIGKALRKALILFKPQNLNLKPNQQLTYKHYGLSRRAKINNYMYKCFLFLYHFCNKSGEDSWALIALASSIFASNSAYIKTTDSTKANVYLKRNASGPQGEGKGEGEDDNNEDDEEVNDNRYEGDYLVNTYGNHKTQGAGSSTRSSTTTNKRARPSEPDSKSRRNDKNPHPSKKQRSESEERSSSPVPLPPQPTNADIRRANKVVAQERARDKALGASRDRAGAKPSAPPKGKEKEKEERDRSRLDHKSKRGHRKEVEVQDEDEDEGEDEEPVQLVFKKVRRVDSGLSSPEPEPAPKKSTKAPPKPSTKATKKTPAKGTSKGKSAKGKDLSPEPVEDFESEPEPVKQRRRPHI